MHSSTLSFLSLSLCLSTAFASPVKQKRYDLDGNGTPDLCNTNSDGTANCMLSDGSWTTFETSTYHSGMLTMSKMAVSTSIAASITTSATTSSVSVNNVAAVTSTSAAAKSTSAFPDAAAFKSGNGSIWSIEYVGDLAFTDTLQAKGLGGDKCRSSTLGDKVIWNCGDMECDGDYTVCGFSMGPAFYGTDSVMTVNTTGLTSVQASDFASAWSGDAQPVSPQTAFGMDTTNIAAINSTHGVAYAWEIWRGASDGSIVDRGNAVVTVTLGDDKPIATRVGALLTGSDAVQLGLLAILRDGDYIYTYSIGGPSGIVIGRVAASDAVFDASAYEFLESGSDSAWSAPASSVPDSSTTAYGMTTASSGGSFSCSVYGSVFYNAYLGKYVIICTAYESFTNMYVADNAWGPWSEEYGLLSGWGVGYGSMAHPEYSTDGGKTIHFSQGPNGVFNMFKVTFDF